MIEFEGWELPVQYEGILPEHRWTRQAASIFDTCHMTQYRVKGNSARKVLSKALACRITSLPVGRCRYGFLLNSSGGVIDDLVCYRLDDKEYMIVANAGTHEKVYDELSERMNSSVVFEDTSNTSAKIDLQGPAAQQVLEDLYGIDTTSLHYFTSTKASLDNIPVLLSRTGYTGELGFEIYSSPDDAGKIWCRLAEHDLVRPAGLGARDTLRLEMGYPLYGHELDENTTPVEAGLSCFLPQDGTYIGHNAIELQQKEGVSKKLAAIKFNGRRAARAGEDVLINGKKIGNITSGAFAPSLGCAVAMAYVKPEKISTGQEIEATVRTNRVRGFVTELPFYTEGTAQT
jgi:aminomethyltransferase